MNMIELGDKQADMFSDNHIPYMELLITGNGIRMVLCSCYSALCGLKKIIPIEALPVQQKTTIWETANEFAKGRLNKEKMIELSKSLYCLEYYLNL